MTSQDEDEIRYRLRDLDGGPLGGNGVTRRSAAPPGFDEGGEILQTVIFRYECGANQLFHFQIQLPWAYCSPAPQAPPDR